MSKLPIEYLRHIYDECAFITGIISADMTAGMRDKLIHDYIGVNYAIVWDVIRNKIPEIKPIIAQIIESESNK